MSCGLVLWLAMPVSVYVLLLLPNSCHECSNYSGDGILSVVCCTIRLTDHGGDRQRLRL